MKKYIRSSLANSEKHETLADTFIAECRPYDFMLFKEFPDCYQLVGIPDPTTESISELIQLVEHICKHYNIEFFDAHYAQGDKGEFIIFKIRKS